MSETKYQEIEWYKKRENLAMIISAISLLFTGVSICYQIAPPPSRATLGIFIDHVHKIIIVGVDSWEFAVVGNIINDSPFTAQIIEWELIIEANMSYDIIATKHQISNRMLLPSEQASFTIGNTLVGENNTILPEKAIRSCLITFLYEDYLGLQSISEEYSYK